ncbi:DISARM system helicase DrmA [Paraliomyxa miuraensis]|uniref:DISARM system helicase DrmA n=1 Tax=Paraliomyxa miuraensis TaxID=376150 RepID=UPI002259599B|nr:DISARM system helicase DrmA [Paraliomyxa miuraensis]MCX4239767.1 DISARM system helicase DrmA [Paraliomyxa miuraensis]
MTTSATVRASLVDALRLDLVGPDPTDPAHAPHATEQLSQSPTKWYLTGFLAPRGAKLDDRTDDEPDEQLDEHEKHKTLGADENSPETAAARRAFFPSSMGLSVLVPADVDALTVTAHWGTYAPILDTSSDASTTEPTPPSIDDRVPTDAPWQRTPHVDTLTVPLRPDTHAHPLPTDPLLRIVVSVRPIPSTNLVPPGTRSVSVFLVNDRSARSGGRRDEGYVFQAALELSAPRPFVPRPDGRGHALEDWDEQVADLQYRDDFEHAVGHNVSVHATLDEHGACHRVRTVWIPRAEVEKVEPTAPPKLAVDLSMEALAKAPSAEAIRSMVGPLVTAYGDWIEDQVTQLPADPGRHETAQRLLEEARAVRDRIADGLAALDDPTVLLAFTLANDAMARAARQRFSVEKQCTPEEVDPPRWRLFQLAFVLMCLRGLSEPTHRDRALVDLLFFPTGGGKTEAYLGLAAFTLVLRRLRHPGVSSAGVSVLMRYTLRLLTLDQLGRATTLICALELLRQDQPDRLGPWPFEIGLWVGQSATPNRMGRKGDKDKHSARSRTLAFERSFDGKGDKRKPSPIPLEDCPWCGQKFGRSSFQLLPDADAPQELRVVCSRRRCAFGGKNPLPVIAVDEPIYRRLPCFLIATVDKFAGLPRIGRTGVLFGRAPRYDAQGFYGPAEPSQGRPLPAPLPPPDLVIQDELHLISGPLGTMAGLYETAIDALCTRTIDDLRVGPKIVASTATVRRATRQIQALFGRTEVDVFPPPGPDRRDSFFARTVPSTDKNARLYVGVAAQGQSAKKVLLRVYLALAAAAQHAWEEHGGAKAERNPADPYMTLLGYFNSLRELGGSRRIVEDEVNARLRLYHRRRRVGEERGPFSRRTIQDFPLELTSRVPTNEVAETKQRLALPFRDKAHIDVALATNMISVGLDIPRLGLMVVQGQPKTAAEYIQATSRVGRDDSRPGLVVTLLNIHRPRDRSHLERFAAWHRVFYRAVEATSVTPFSPRALDRGLAAVTVALARLKVPELTAPAQAVAMARMRKDVAHVPRTLANRAQHHDPTLPTPEQTALGQRVHAQVERILEDWAELATRNQQTGSGLQYAKEMGSYPALLADPLDAGVGHREFRAPWSLRDVEPSANLWVRHPDGRDELEEDDR